MLENIKTVIAPFMEEEADHSSLPTVLTTVEFLPVLKQFLDYAKTYANDDADAKHSDEVLPLFRELREVHDKLRDILMACGTQLVAHTKGPHVENLVNIGPQFASCMALVSTATSTHWNSLSSALADFLRLLTEGNDVSIQQAEAVQKLRQSLTTVEQATAAGLPGNDDWINFSGSDIYAYIEGNAQSVEQSIFNYAVTTVALTANESHPDFQLLRDQKQKLLDGKKSLPSKAYNVVLGADIRDKVAELSGATLTS